MFLAIFILNGHNLANQPQLSILKTVTTHSTENMEALHKLPEYNLEIIQSFINNDIEESINIEFKSSGAISRKPSIKKEISKDVSAFANSDGGIIIYGIEEKDHKASAISYINGNEFTKEFLEQVINSTIKRTIFDIKIFAVREHGDIMKTIYVVQIPQSFDAPHMSIDKKYYRRYNFESILMEEYEVRALYGRKLKSKLKIAKLSFIVKPVENQDNVIRFLLTMGIENIGEIAIKEYSANIYFIGELNYCNINYDTIGQGQHYSHTVLESEIKFTNENPSIIFPSEKLDILTINFDIEIEHLETFIRNFELRAKLFWENEFTEYSYDKKDQIISDYLGKKNSFKFLD